MDVSVVDFRSATAPEDFTSSLRDTGFAVLINHPLEQRLVEQIYQEWRDLFDSPAVHRYLVDAGGQVGWFPPDRSETAKGSSVRDLKEFFHVYDWSVYPDEVSDAAMRYRSVAIQIASTLLRWIEDNCPPDIRSGFSQPLTTMLDGSRRTLLRILRYPPLDADAPDGAVRAAAHTDINLLTVLPASDEAGLELQASDGTWHQVPCDPGSIAVNAGEMLQMASNGYFPATKHRVVNPLGDAATRSRMSLPLFLQPADDLVLADGRTASSFLEERIRELRGKGS
ncbi:2OG-Fe(II) oxygenase family protein [soil metagenome]